MTKLTSAASRKKNFLERLIAEGITQEEAEEQWKEQFRKIGSIGGKKTTSRPFRDVPGLAKRAGSKRNDKA